MLELMKILVMESVWKLSGGCLEDVLEVSDYSVSDPGYYQGCKM